MNHRDLLETAGIDRVAPREVKMNHSVVLADEIIQHRRERRLAYEVDWTDYLDNVIARENHRLIAYSPATQDAIGLEVRLPARSQ